MKFFTIIVFFSFLLTNCTEEDVDVQEISNIQESKGILNYSLLWNPKITKKSWVFYDQNQSIFRWLFSNLSEGHLVDNPPHQWDAIYEDPIDNKTFYASDSSNYSLMWVTWNYDYGQKQTYPGFDFWTLNENRISNDIPLEFRIINNAKFLSNPDELREVGFLFNNWPQYWAADNVWSGGNHSFKNNYNINDFNSLKVTFKSRLDNYNSPLNNTFWSGGYVTCDFRFNVYNENGSIFKSYLIGVVFSNPSNKDFNGNNQDNILFSHTVNNDGAELERVLLHGNKVGVTNIDTSYKNITIDFKPLILQYLTFDTNSNKKNIITGLDIYSATRGADIAYDIKEIDFEGY